MTRKTNLRTVVANNCADAAPRGDDFFRHPPVDLLKCPIDGGSATGATGLIVANTTGGGALTTANGILIVDAINGGVTDTSSFHLTARRLLGRTNTPSIGAESMPAVRRIGICDRSSLLAPRPGPTPDYRPAVSRDPLDGGDLWPARYRHSA
jgi:hypothetical protein